MLNSISFLALFVFLTSCFASVPIKLHSALCPIAAMRYKPSLTAYWAFRVVKFLKMPMSALFV